MPSRPAPFSSPVPLPFGGSLTDVAGLTVGHHSDARRPTGCTVVLCPQGAVAGVDVRGAAPGTRECELLHPSNTVSQVHALLLAGGSAFGLDAASGVVRWLDDHGHGLPVGPARVPIVPAAVLFDLWVGDPGIRPEAAGGHAACAAAHGGPVEQGNVGAGSGATVGKLWGPTGAMKGGLGSASLQAQGITVAALVAVNAVGDVRDPRDGRLLAGARGPDGRLRDSAAALAAGDWPTALIAGANTSIGVIATDAVLDKPQAHRVATMAHDGLARTIAPVHTPFDGDALFALATGASGRRVEAGIIGALAAEAVARAVVNAVLHARSLPGLPAWAELPQRSQSMP